MAKTISGLLHFTDWKESIPRYDGTMFTINESIHQGCVQSTHRVPKVVIRLWLTSKQQICALEKILGWAIAIGLHCRRPKVAERTRHVSENDTFNVIRVQHVAGVPLERNNKFGATTFGLDFIYDEEYHLLSLHVRYEKWILLTNRSGRPVICPLESLESMLTFGQDQEEQQPTMNMAGTGDVKVDVVLCEKEKDGSVIPYEVTHLLSNNKCQCQNLANDSAEETCFDSNHVAKKLLLGRI